MRHSFHAFYLSLVDRVAEFLEEKRGRKHHQNRSLSRRQARLLLECLEDRIAPATYTWNNPNGGDWSTVSNWTVNNVVATQLPGANDDAVINLANPNVTITHSGGADTISSLVSNAAIKLSGGALNVTGTVQVNNTFTLSGGTLGSATVQAGTTITGTTAGG